MPKKPARKWSDEVKRSIIARYEKGESPTMLAAELDVHVPTIYQWLRQRGKKAKKAGVGGPIAKRGRPKGTTAARPAAKAEVTKIEALTPTAWSVPKERSLEEILGDVRAELDSLRAFKAAVLQLAAG